MRKAYKGANPYYDSNREFSENCQRAVVAYEMRRRGYDVIAAPTYEGDNLPYAAHQNADGTRNSYWMGAFKGAKPESVAARTNKEVYSNIVAKMKEYGNGSRAIIAVQYQGYRSGHVFNIENKNGRIYAVDAQVGEPVPLKDFLRVTKPGRTQIVRTDNLRISERAKKSVSPAKTVRRR